MRWMLWFFVGLVSMAGCLGTAQDPGEPESVPEIVETEQALEHVSALIESLETNGPHPFVLQWQWEDCWSGGPVWFVPIAYAQSFLPPGFVAATGAEFFLKDQLDALEDLLGPQPVADATGQGMILAFQHMCEYSTLDDGAGYNTVLWIAIKDAEAGSSLPERPITQAFSLGTGGPGFFGEIQAALGETGLADQIKVDQFDVDPLLGPVQETTMLSKGKEVYWTRTGPGIDTVPSRNIRAYSMPPEGGLMALHVTTEPAGDRNYLTVDVACEMAPDSLYAQVIPGASCDVNPDAMVIGNTQSPHDHATATLYYDPDWVAGPMNIAGPLVVHGGRSAPSQHAVVPETVNLHSLAQGVLP